MWLGNLVFNWVLCPLKWNKENKENGFYMQLSLFTCAMVASPVCSFLICQMGRRVSSPWCFCDGYRGMLYEWYLVLEQSKHYHGCFSYSHFPCHYCNIRLYGHLRYDIHINLWITSLSGLTCALFAIGVSLYCLSSIMPKRGDVISSCPKYYRELGISHSLKWKRISHSND